nr:DUF268 domain-containing protein [uncultured Desulfobacter sp.]
MTLMPCLHDRYEEGGITRNEYFWQDLIVAQYIYKAAPEKHVDIGSRIDGFVGHVASFREIEVFDVRPVRARVPGVKFRQENLMAKKFSVGHEGYCDSLSCLHAIEHFGLGRYGDPIVPDGYKNGIVNMAKMLQTGGTFYLSTPIGKEQVMFNANWIFNFNMIVRCAKDNELRLIKLVIVHPETGPAEVPLNSPEIENLAKSSYHLVLFVFQKR